MGRLIFIIGIIVILAAFVYILFNSNKAQPGQNISNIYLPNYNQGLDINLSDGYRQTDFPTITELPIIKTQTPTTLTEEQAKQIAQNLGMNGELQSTEDAVRGTIYFLVDEDDSLTVFPRERRFEYATNVSVPESVTGNLNMPEIISTSQNFISTALPNNTMNLKYSSSNYLHASVNDSDGAITISTPEQANMIKNNFSPSLEQDLPLLWFDPTGEVSYVTTTPDGEIIKASVNLLPSEIVSQDKFQLKTFEEVVNSLPNAKVIYFNNLELDPKTNPVSSVTINSISLAYLYDGVNRDQITPIFVLKGTANGNTLPPNTEVTLYLPAISEQ